MSVITDVALRSTLSFNLSTGNFTLLFNTFNATDRVTLTDPAKRVGASFPPSVFRNQSGKLEINKDLPEFENSYSQPVHYILQSLYQPG